MLGRGNLKMLVVDSKKHCFWKGHNARWPSGVIKVTKIHTEHTQTQTDRHTPTYTYTHTTWMCAFFETLTCTSNTAQIKVFTKCKYQVNQVCASASMQQKKTFRCRKLTLTVHRSNSGVSPFCSRASAGCRASQEELQDTGWHLQSRQVLSAV